QRYCQASSSLVRGRILFCGKDIRSLLPFELVRHGLVHVPEGRRVFSTLTVEENLVLGLYGVRHSLSDAEVQKRKEWIFRLFPVLRERRRQLAGTLSGGEQQMLALGRGLISRPKVLLLDEPSLGLAPRMVQDIFQLIQGIHQEEGVSILLVEQNVRRALSVASYAYVLESGRVVLSGKPSDLLRDERLHAAYLGGSGIKRRMSCGLRSPLSVVRYRGVAVYGSVFQGSCAQNPRTREEEA
ncbi:MAG: ABC transporter ATP-binding protein, partial [Candidatus Caldatribacterium sp.]|nr:ABC transporter ATP-binding protein [Candidatus Caldatribacterium sp.]